MQGHEQNGYFFQDMGNKAKEKTTAINKPMSHSVRLDSRPNFKNGPMDPDQMADSILKNANRIVDMFDEDFVKITTSSSLRDVKDGYKTSDLMV